MTDIARLGIDADTSDLSLAIKSLDKLSVSAAKAEADTKKLERAMSSASLKAAQAASIQATAAFKAAAGNKAVGASDRAAAADAARSASAALATARAHDMQAAAALAASKANLMAAQSAQAIVDANQSIATSAVSAKNHMALTSGQMQSNFTNMAAQFQDIGVTAAMGMSPLMIGLQQGAQMSGIFAGQAGGLSNVVRTMGAAFMSVLSPVSLLIIGLVSGVAALVQWVDWANVAKVALLGLADVLPQVATGAMYLGGVMAVAFGPQILAGIVSITIAIGVGLYNAIIKATMAMLAFSAANPFTALVLAIGIALAAAYVFRDKLTKILGFDIIKVVKYGAEFVIDVFKTAYDVTVQNWRLLPAVMGEIVIDMANNVIKGVNQMVEEAIIKMNPLLRIADSLGINTGIRGMLSGGGDAIPNAFRGSYGKVAESAKKSWAKNRSTDDLGAMGDAFNNFITDVQGKLRGYANTIGMSDKKDRKSKADSAAKAEPTNEEKFLDMMAEANAKVEALKREGEAIGLVGEAAEIAAARNDLLNQAKSEGIILGEKELPILEAVAVAIGKQVQENKHLQWWQDLIDLSDELSRSLNAEAGEIGLVGAALAAYRWETEQLNKAKRDNIVLTEMERAAIHASAVAVGEKTAANKNLQAFTDTRVAISENIDNLNDELNMLGMSSEAIAMQRFEREMLNDEVYRGIVLSEHQKEALRELKSEEIALTAEIKRQREQMDFAKGAARGFIGDLRSGLESGKSIWKSFGDAVMNVVDKIINKLMDDLIDALFQVNKASGGSGGLFGSGGFFPSLMGALGGGLSSAGIASSNLSVGNTIASNPGLFADGGAFVNGVVHRPTAFFAKGGSPGIMGEAGPEAIMPLQRGPDGSLGIQMYGQAGVANDNAGGPPITFDMRGAVVTPDLLKQMEAIAANRADVAVVQNNNRMQRKDQRRLAK